MVRQREAADPEPVEPAPDGAGLAARLPESLTEPLVVNVELPELVHAPAEDEIAVAIDSVAITPLADAATGAVTVMIDVDTDAVATMPPHDELSSTLEPVVTAMATGPVLRGAAPSTDADADVAPRRAAPEGRWRSFVYAASLHQVNLGDAPRIRERKALDARIGRHLGERTRFVPVLTRKGGVGKTTISAVLGMALAEVRDDRVLAIDANPDRGTLADRVPQQTRSTVRDLVIHAPEIRDVDEFASYVSRDPSGLLVLASDTDPLRSSAFNEDEYNVVADIAERFCSVVLTDCGTGIVHSVMKATLSRADQLVIVSGGSIDEARLASETLTWLEANEYRELARNAVVALNTATANTKLSQLDELESHFRSRVRAVVRIPYDPELAAGSIVRFDALRPFTRDSVRELAALVVDGLGEPEQSHEVTA